MNLLDKKYGLVWLLSALIFLSCEEPRELGLDKSDSGIGVIFTDTFTIHTSTVLLDSINTTSPGILSFGKFIEPKLGSVTANAFTQVHLNQQKVNGDAIYDSAFIALHIDYKYGSSTNTAQELRIYELESSLSDTTYFAQNSVSFFEDNAHQLNSQTSFNVSDEEDTIIMTLRLDDDVVQEKFFDPMKATSSHFNSQADFVKWFKGIAIIPGADNTAIFGVNGRQDTTGIIIYYHYPGDTLSKALELKFGGQVYHFNQLIHDRSGTPLENIPRFTEVPSEQTDHATFVQAGTGFATKITFPYLAKFSENRNIAIQRAELVFPTVDPDDDSYAHPVPVLFLAETNQNNRFLKDQNGGIMAVQANDPSTTFLNVNPLQIAYNPNERHYSGPVTYYLQAVIDAKKPNNSLLLVSLIDSYNDLGEYRINKVYLADQHHNLNKARLRVFYTEIK